MVQWLSLCASNAAGAGLIPGWGTEIPHAAGRGQKKNPKTIRTKHNMFIAIKKPHSLERNVGLAGRTEVKKGKLKMVFIKN